MIKTRQIILAAAIAAAFAGDALAADQIVLASLGDVNGKVLVNKGKGFVSAKDGMEVRTGDRVIALDKASAKVVYSDGCVTNLKENKLLTMGSQGCEKQADNAGSENLKLAQALGGTRTDIPAGSGDLAGAGAGGAAGGAAGLTPLAIAGIVGGVAVVGVAIHNANNNDDTPVSAE
ncbi:hypothetical protein [Propionivibrio sp.]|uniref:hypothetical protein n=1 Tax=Propionivibrio sp. TaxID=2212460 RepID=UPI00262C953B|nr:hypothetical protein [Propionivibrio sp.]